MYGKLLNTIINILFITYLLLLVSFYFLHEGVKENINNINYTTVDTVSTQGVFNVDTYNNMKEKVFNYAGVDCNYEVTIKYEQKVAPGVYTTHFLKDTISATNMFYPDETYVNDYNSTNGTSLTLEELLKKVDPDGIISVSNKSPRPMYKGDRLTIYLEDQNQTLYGKLITMPFMGMLDNYTDFRIKSLKASMIGRDANKLVNGYDVIAEINDTTRGYTIELVTEISTAGGTPSKLFAPGALYSDTGSDTNISISGGTATIGTFHVFGTLDYYRVWQDAGISGTPNGIEDAGDLVSFYQTTE